MGIQLKKLRIKLGLTQQQVADRLGIGRNNIAKYETGVNEPSDAVVALICREFKVNETWLRTGEGEMFRIRPDEEETGVYVSELLEYEDNPLYDIIKEIMRTYSECSPKSQEVIRDFSAKLRENMQNKKES